MAKLIILVYDYFGENHTPLMSYGMAAIPKIGDTNKWLIRSILKAGFISLKS